MSESDSESVVSVYCDERRRSDDRRWESIFSALDRVRSILVKRNNMLKTQIISRLQSPSSPNERSRILSEPVTPREYGVNAEVPSLDSIESGYLSDDYSFPSHHQVPNYGSQKEEHYPSRGKKTEHKSDRDRVRCNPPNSQLHLDDPPHGNFQASNDGYSSGSSDDLSLGEVRPPREKCRFQPRIAVDVASLSPVQSIASNDSLTEVSSTSEYGSKTSTASSSGTLGDFPLMDRRDFCDQNLVNRYRNERKPVEMNYLETSFGAIQLLKIESSEC